MISMVMQKDIGVKMAKNEVIVKIDDVAKEFIDILCKTFKEKKYKSFTEINVGSKESPDMKIFYKGKELRNVSQVTLNSASMEFVEGEERVVSWKNKILGDK